jgi:hypothetical protein
MVANAFKELAASVIKVTEERNANLEPTKRVEMKNQ